MFLAHYGVALGAKRFAPTLSLGSLVLACQFIDLLWPILVLLGLEKLDIEPGITLVTPLNFTHYPFSNSLVGTLVWALLLGSVFYIMLRQRFLSIVIGLVVISHWFLDLIVHRPDLQIIPGNDFRAGFSLWDSYAFTFALELGILAVGAVIYIQATRARDWLGSCLLWSTLILMLAIYFASVFGPPPPNSTTVAISALALWLTVFLFQWVERHRMIRNT